MGFRMERPVLAETDLLAGGGRGEVLNGLPGAEEYAEVGTEAGMRT